MVLTAIIRISQVHTKTYDIWATFWQQLEGCVAILMVSLTAFRALFVSSAHRSRQREQRPPRSYRKSWYRYKSSRERERRAMERVEVEVTVPSATLTGMRTFIRGSPRTSIAPSHVQDAHDPRRHAINVTHDLRWDCDSIAPLQSLTRSGSLSTQKSREPSLVRES